MGRFAEIFGRRLVLNSGIVPFPYNPCLWTDGITTLAVHVDDSMIVSTGPGCDKLIAYLRTCYGDDSINIKPMSDTDAHFWGRPGASKPRTRRS